MTNPSLQDSIKSHYAEAARQAARGAAACCADSCCGDPVSSNLYTDVERAAVPDRALRASLGCGNPTALIDLQLGQTVLDLGSGGGIDVLLSARRVGPTGKAYGLDMTDEMLALARENQRAAGVTNVEFLKGEIERIPLPDESVDVIISNCVINLSEDKDRVLREAFRVLKPGGRFAVSDVVARGPVPASLRGDAELWAGCVGGALDVDAYREKLARACFEGIEVETWREYDVPNAPGLFASAFIRARKPAPSCCGTDCCRG